MTERTELAEELSEATAKLNKALEWVEENIIDASFGKGPNILGFEADIDEIMERIKKL